MSHASVPPDAPDLPGPEEAAPERTAALPVELDLSSSRAAGVRAWVEGTLGWQPVTGVTAGLVPPLAVIRDLASSTPPTATDGVPSVLLVDDEASPLEAGRGVARLRPQAVVAWPSGRDELADTVEELLARPQRRDDHGATLRIGGSAGGVGTTTVALALAGLAAWRGTVTLAAVRGNGSTLRALPTAALGGVGLWSRADELPGVPRCRAVQLTDRGPVPRRSDPTVDLLVLDAGVDAEVDVLVCRPDAAGLAGLETTSAAAVVVAGGGAASGRELRRVAGGRRGILLPWSARVARAGLTGRVPAGLPGAWVKRLAPLLPDARQRPVDERCW